MTHTPTPWRIGSVSNEYQSIVCDDNANGVTIWLANADARGNVASHIVKCVNMHDELVEAFELLIDNISPEAWEALPQYVQEQVMQAFNNAKAEASHA